MLLLGAVVLGLVALVVLVVGWMLWADLIAAPPSEYD